PALKYRSAPTKPAFAGWGCTPRPSPRRRTLYVQIWISIQRQVSNQPQSRTTHFPSSVRLPRSHQPEKELLQRLPLRGEGHQPRAALDHSAGNFRDVRLAFNPGRNSIPLALDTRAERLEALPRRGRHPLGLQVNARGEVQQVDHTSLGHDLAALKNSDLVAG